MLSGFAYDAYYNHSAQSAKNYFLVWDYAINQGFAFGSGMGTNHHYGYQVRKIYTTAWLMRDAIWKAPNRDNILSALIFWSALQETRIPFQYGRDELLDSWHHPCLMGKNRYLHSCLWTKGKEHLGPCRTLQMAEWFLAIQSGNHWRYQGRRNNLPPRRILSCLYHRSARHGRAVHSTHQPYPVRAYHGSTPGAEIRIHIYAQLLQHL